MAVVTQKDIVKIINSSIDNIEVIINSLAKNIDKIISNADADKLKDNIEEIKSVSNVVGNYIKIITDLISKIPDIKSSNSAKIGTSAVALNNATQLVVTFVETINNDKLKEIDKSSFKRVDDITMILNSLSKMFNTMNNMCQPGIHLIGLGKQGEFAIKSIIKILEATKDFKKIDTEAAANNIEHVNKVINSLHSIFLNVSKMITLSLVVALAGWIIIGAVLMIVFLAKIIVKLVAVVGVSNSASKRIKNLETIFISLYSIMKTLVKMIPTSILAVVGIIFAIVFVSLLIIVTLTINLLLKVTSKIDNKTAKQIAGLGKVFKSLISVAGAIIFLALIAPVAAFALVMIVIPFLLLMLLVFAIMAVSLFLLRQLSSFSRKQMMVIAWNLLIMVGIFIIICIAIVLAATAGQIIQKEGAIETIIIGLIGIATMLGVIISISKLLNKKTVKSNLLGFRKIFPILLQILGLIGLLMLSLILIGETGKYVAANWDNILFGLSGVSVVAVLVGSISYTIKSLGNKLLGTNAPIMVLLTILGLLVLVGLAIIAFGEVGKYIVDNFLYVLTGFICMLLVLGVIIEFAIALVACAPELSAGTVAITPLLIILGLIVTAALSIILFGEVGKYIVDNIGYILVGFVCMLLVVGVIIEFAIALVACAPELSASIVAITPLLIILGLIVTAALSIIIFGETGKYIVDNIINILAGLAGIVVIVAVIVGLAMALSAAVPFLTAGIVAITPLLIILGLIVAAALSIIIFGETGKYLSENLEFIIAGFAGIIVVIGAIVAFSIALTTAMVPIMAAAVVASITLLAVGLLVGLILAIALGVKSIAEIEIDEEKVKKSLQSIKSIISTLASEIKDLLTGEDADSPIFELPDPKFFEFIPFKKRKATAIDKLDNVTKIIGSIKGIAEALIKIEKFKITPAKETNITNSVNSIFNIITVLADRITKMLSDPNSIHFDDNIVKESTWWGGEKEVEKENLNISRLDNVSKITTSLGAITNALNDIQKLSINESSINAKIDSIFAYVDKLGVKIEENLTKSGILKKLEDEVIREEKTDFWGDTETTVTVIENQIAKNMGRVGQMFGALGDILNTLKSLSEFEITDELKAKIDTNINNLFDYITSLSIKIEQLLNPKVADIPLVYSPEIIDKKFADKELIADIIKNRSEEYSNNLDSVSKMFISVATILENLDKIKELKFTESTKKDITDKINLIFSSIEEIILAVSTGIEKLPSDGLDVTDLDNFSNGLSNLHDVMKRLTELKIDNFTKTKNTIIGFLKELTALNLDAFTNADKVCLTIKSMTDMLGSNNVLSLKMADIKLGHLERLNKIIISLSEVTPNKVKNSKELLNDQMKYLDKINKTDITKLQTTTRMIGHMAELSKSIRGNFQGLAETLNEEIAPLLEKLKELLENLNTNVNNIGNGIYGGDTYDYSMSDTESTETSEDTDTSTQNTKSSSSSDNFKDGNKSNTALNASQKSAFEKQIESNQNIAQLVGDIYQLMLGIDNNVFGNPGVKVGN